MATFIDQNGISCFIDQNGITEFVDQNGNLLTCGAFTTDTPTGRGHGKGRFPVAGNWRFAATVALAIGLTVLL